MKLTLKEFQDEAVKRLVRFLRSAAKDSRAGDLQAVCLSSVTGSGKTVMLTKSIELLIQGDEEHAPIADATFLWVTDQPELNEQTRRKMLATSSVLISETLIVIDASFDQETLQPGAVHFLNIQKLGKDKGLVSQGDKRTYTIWDIIRNTIGARPGKFFVVIDEAHRGMIEEKGQQEATTIIQKFIKGAKNEIPPVPIVVGMSATPERFNTLIAGVSRANRPVDVDVQEVRQSGLIKDSIVLHHPKKEQPTDMTMLREAAKSLKTFTTQWSAYCAVQEEFEVVPLLIVQVDDAGAKGQHSETDISQAIRVIRDVLGTMPNDAFAHSFQDGTVLDFGGQELRYLAPSDIQADGEIRVVFFKSSLNTGWDCPRAEVMMSFRTAADSTYIAQLVGRMVRTPLARRIVDNEVLNTVALYLPHYDSKGLKRVIDKLSKPDDESIPPVDIEEGDNVIDLAKAADSDKYFDALSKLPSYVVPRPRKANQVRRLMKFARLLTNDGIYDEAISIGYEKLIELLNKEYNRVKKDKRFKQIVEEKATIEINSVNWDVGTDVFYQGDSVKVDIAAENVDDLFDAAGRKLNEGLHTKWWRARVKNDAAAREKAKLELFALTVNPEIIAKLQKTAAELVQAWQKKFKIAIGKLDERSREGYAEINSLAADPELTTLVFPATIHIRQGDQEWNKHLYVNDSCKFPANFNNNEIAVLNREVAKRGVLAWLRNIDRKPWALCIDYEVQGEKRAMYPDFLFIRSDKRTLVVDIIEPHSINLADAPAKAAGLAKFAAKHHDQFGRIELVLINGDKTKTLDLTNETDRKKVIGAQVIGQLQALFD